MLPMVGGRKRKQSYKQSSINDIACSSSNNNSSSSSNSNNNTSSSGGIGIASSSTSSTSSINNNNHYSNEQQQFTNNKTSIDLDKDDEKEGPNAKICKQDDYDLCTICLEILTTKERSVLKTCNHAFCFECIYKWLKRRRACPLCNAEPKEILFSIQSTLKYRVTEPPETQCLCQSPFPRHLRQRHVKLYELMGVKDWSTNQRLPEIFLKTIMRKMPVRSKNVERLLYYLVDPIQVLSAEPTNDMPEECTSWNFIHDTYNLLRHELKYFNLDIMNIITYPYVQAVLRDFNDINLLDKHCIDFHCCLNAHLPLQIVKKLWALLLIYLRKRIPARFIVFRFGLQQTCGEEELFPANDHPQRAEVILCDVVVDYFKRIMQSTSSSSSLSSSSFTSTTTTTFMSSSSSTSPLAKAILESVRQQVRLSSPYSSCPEIERLDKQTLPQFLHCYLRIMLSEYRKGTNPIVNHWAFLYRQHQQQRPGGGLHHHQQQHDHRHSSELPSLSSSGATEAIVIDDDQDDDEEEISFEVPLRNRIISVIDRLTIRRHLRSEQYQRNRIRNFVQLQQAEEPQSQQSNTSSSTSSHHNRYFTAIPTPDPDESPPPPIIIDLTTGFDNETIDLTTTTPTTVAAAVATTAVVDERSDYYSFSPSNIPSANNSSASPFPSQSSSSSPMLFHSLSNVGDHDNNSTSSSSSSSSSSLSSSTSNVISASICDIFASFDSPNDILSLNNNMNNNFGDDGDHSSSFLPHCAGNVMNYPSSGLMLMHHNVVGHEQNNNDYRRRQQQLGEINENFDQITQDGLMTPPSSFSDFCLAASFLTPPPPPSSPSFSPFSFVNNINNNSLHYSSSSSSLPQIHHPFLPSTSFNNSHNNHSTSTSANNSTTMCSRTAEFTESSFSLADLSSIDLANIARLSNEFQQS